MKTNDQGEFVRNESTFRALVSSTPGSRFTAEPHRYHLYISWACPWAHRTAIVRSLLGLEKVISLSAVDPLWSENGWTFTDAPGCIPDTVNHKRDLIEIYRLADPHFQGDETTPVLWDKKLKTIVNNESLEIIKILATEFLPLSQTQMDLYPKNQRVFIDQVISELYSNINHGVYEVGFASSQKAYDQACQKLFSGLDHWEEKLSQHRYLCGKQITLADICLFVTLFRFDLVYYSHFKCNLKHIYEYPNLWGFVLDLYQTPGVAETCNLDHIKRHYYACQDFINPTKIVPMGPILDFTTPHKRAEL